MDANLRNWIFLSEAGVCASAPTNGSLVRFEEVPNEYVNSLVLALITHLDQLVSWWPDRKQKTLEQLVWEREMVGFDRDFEARPADRNCAVRVRQRGLTSTVTVDVRNQFEDDPTLHGCSRLQQAVIDAVESLKL